MNLNPNITVKAQQVITPDGATYATDARCSIPSENVIFSVKMGTGADAPWHLILKENWKIVVPDVNKLNLNVDNPLKERTVDTTPTV